MTHHVSMTSSSVVHDVMNRWPQTIEVFIGHRMACVGCAMGRFCSVAAAAEEYHLDCAAFLTELEQATLRQQTSQGDRS